MGGGAGSIFRMRERVPPVGSLAYLSSRNHRGRIGSIVPRLLLMVLSGRRKSYHGVVRIYNCSGVRINLLEGSCSRNVYCHSHLLGDVLLLQQIYHHRGRSGKQSVQIGAMILGCVQSDIQTVVDPVLMGGYG